MKLKKIFLSVAFVFATFCAFAQSGSFGNFVWTIQDTVLTVSGKGATLTDYSYNSVPWYSYSVNIKTIIVEEGCTSLGHNLFYACSNVKNVYLPATLTSISVSTFRYTSTPNVQFFMKSFTPPTMSSVLMSETSCKAIVPLGAEDNYKSSLYWDFCISIENYPLPASGASGGFSWNINTEGVFTLTGTGAMEDYENDLATPWYVYQRAITKIVIPQGVTHIGNNVFANSAVKAITFPSTLTSIGDKAFFGCIKPSTLIFPEGLLTIGDSAFMDCLELDYLYFGVSLTKVGNGAFANCTKINTIRFNASNCSQIGSEEAPAFKTCISIETVLLDVNVRRIPAYMFAGLFLSFELLHIEDGDVVGGERKQDFIIPSYVTTIGKGAFLGLSQIASLYIPSSITTIEGEAFRGCSGLSTIIVEKATPPTLTGDLVFHNVKRGDCYLYVPTSSVATYKAIAQWRDFIHIVDLSYNRAELSALRINGSSVPDFDVSTYMYEIEVPYQVEQITISAEAFGSGTIAGDGTFDLNVGINTFFVSVTAPSGTTTTTYTLFVTRRNMSVNIDENTLSQKLSVYPNPMTGNELHIDGAQIKSGDVIKMFSTTGQLIRTAIATGKSTTANMLGLTSGTYIVCVNGKTVKVVK
ncbi:MAG: leucine-rich repeat protein [Bacteroidales bacterium]|jgi:hypothetical protein|nr:leucine-rich repeat protein [Bacteroidales bacterium]